MKITFTTYCSKDYAALGDLVLPNRKAYCAKHGYDLIVHDQPITGRGCNWDKLVIIQKALETSDVVVWNGIDVLVMNPAFKVETILQQNPKASAILTSDVFGLNSDNMIFRRDGWSDMLLSAVGMLGYAWYRNHIWGEQEALIRLTTAIPYINHVAFVEQNVMNSYVNSLYGRPSHWPGDYRPGDWLVHLPGLPFEQRIAAAKKLLPFSQSAAALGGSRPMPAAVPHESAGGTLPPAAAGRPAEATVAPSLMNVG